MVCKEPFNGLPWRIILLPSSFASINLGNPPKVSINKTEHLLYQYAKKRLSKGGDDPYTYTFRMAECNQCGITPVELTIEHHSGSKVNDFKGILFTTCTNYHQEKEFLHFTGSHRTPQSQVKPVCRCGSRHFYAGECESYENDEFLAGFFDEGVVVGLCAGCQKMVVFVYTD
jgi:hypothetical protein